MTACWEKTARLGGFQKFLGYTLLSVACFLHPVLVWHVTIPGTMLIITGAAYFFLSKKKKVKSAEESVDQAKEYRDPTATAVQMTHAGDTEQTYTFNSSFKVRKASLLTQMKSILKVSRDKTPLKIPVGMVDLSTEAGDQPSQRKQVHFEEKVVRIVPSVTGSLDEPDSDPEEEITSDTAPIIPPREAHGMASMQLTIGIF